MTDDLKAKYADRIAKLLAKAESTTPEEAENLTQKAQELMAKYAIDEALLQAARGFRGERDKVVKEEFVVYGIYRFPVADLALAALRFCDCKIVVLSGKNPRTVDGKLRRETIVYWGVGFKADVDRARILFTSLWLQASRAENAWWRENQHLHEDKPKGGHYERRQFLFSFASAAHLKMVTAKQKAQQQAVKEHSSSGVELALRDKNAMVKDAYEDMFPSLTKGRGKNYQGGSYDSSSAGYAAGQRADIGGDKVGGGSSRKQIKGAK